MLFVPPTRTTTSCTHTALPPPPPHTHPTHPRPPLPLADAFIIATVILALTALPGFQESSPAPLVALWRVVATALGVGVEVLAVSLVMPVTAK